MAHPTPAKAASTACSGEHATQRLAEYASALRYDNLPESVIKRAKQCLADSIACAVFGQQFPWSAMVLAEARASGGGGPCRLPGLANETFHVPQAALALGAFAHAFECDSLRKPGSGVHPGATVALPALAMAQAVKASGADLLVAIVAGVEVMFRIGAATLHSPEKVGFHAPGLTGPFGAAAACASLMRLSALETANAFGLAGSLAGGLLAFAKADSGGMVKRLHLGRAAEGGVLAARLAQRGYEGPRNVLEGRYGLLEAFCEETSPGLLTQGLGERFETELICFKRYPCHVTAHVPIEMLRGMMAERGFAGDDVRDLVVEASAKVASHHANADPADIMLAQYSVPFCLALAAYYDPGEPSTFSERTIADGRVRDLARRVRISPDAGIKGWGARLKVVLRDGRSFEQAGEAWPGCPEAPLSDRDLRNKFDNLVKASPQRLRPSLLDDLLDLERISTVAELLLT